MGHSVIDWLFGKDEPKRNGAEPVARDEETPEEVLDALEWSDLDSGETLERRAAKVREITEREKVPA